MSDIAGWFLAMIWLGLGGFAFAKLPDDGKSPPIVVVLGFLIFLALGPAVFGFWLAKRPAPPTPKESKP